MKAAQSEFEKAVRDVIDSLRVILQWLNSRFKESSQGVW
jgi:hypothetical protein